MKLLNMGSGNIHIDGFVNVDINPKFADVVCDFRVAPYPFEDNTIDKIVAAHIVEHLYADENLLFMDECWRILKPGGTLEVIFPLWDSKDAWIDPTHVRAIHPGQYKYFTAEMDLGYTKRLWTIVRSITVDTVEGIILIPVK